MTIYEIDKAILDAYEKAMDPETGEVTDDEVFASIDELMMAREEKCENIACWIKDLAADIAAIREEEKALASRRLVMTNKAERLKKYLELCLDGKKLNTARCAVSFRKSQSVEIKSFAEIPEQFLRFKDPEPDKAKIKDALKAGEVVPGAELVENVSVIIK